MPLMFVHFSVHDQSYCDPLPTSNLLLLPLLPMSRPLPSAVISFLRLIRDSHLCELSRPICVPSTSAWANLLIAEMNQVQPTGSETSIRPTAGEISWSYPLSYICFKPYSPEVSPLKGHYHACYAIIILCCKSTFAFHLWEA